MFIVLCSFKGFFVGCSVDVPSASGRLRLRRRLEHRRVTCPGHLGNPQLSQDEVLGLAAGARAL